MQKLNRPIVLSVAGYDPSGGAGLLADIKTIEQHKVYGLGIASALTFQTENEFFSLKWADEKEVVFQQKIKLNSPNAGVIKGQLEYMACNNIHCNQPEDIDFTIPLGK